MAAFVQPVLFGKGNGVDLNNGNSTEARSPSHPHPAVVRHYCHLVAALLLPGRTNCHHASELVSTHAPPKMVMLLGQEAKSPCRDSRNITISQRRPMIGDGSFSESFADMKKSQIMIICFTYQHKKSH